MIIGIRRCLECNNPMFFFFLTISKYKFEHLRFSCILGELWFFFCFFFFLSTRLLNKKQSSWKKSIASLVTSISQSTISQQGLCFWWKGLSHPLPSPQCLVKVKVTQSYPTLCDPTDYTVREVLQARILEWEASRSLLQGIFPIQGSNPGLPNCRWISLPAKPPGKPKDTGVGSLSLLQWIFLTQELNRVSCITGRFFTNWAIRKALYK